MMMMMIHVKVDGKDLRKKEKNPPQKKKNPPQHPPKDEAVTPLTGKDEAVPLTSRESDAKSQKIKKH